MDMEECRKTRNDLAEKYYSTLVDGVAYKMSDEDFLKYVEATVHFQILSGEHPIGKMGYVLKDALEDKSVECLEKLAGLLLGLGLEGVEYFGQMARLRAIERRYALEEDDEELDELSRKVKNPDDLVSYYQAKAIQITSAGFYPRILDHAVEHGYITKEAREKIEKERERFKPRERRS